MKVVEGQLRQELQGDPFYERCCLTGASTKVTKIDCYFNLEDVEDRWSIIPVAREFRERMTDPSIRDLCDRVMLNRATDEELKEHSKAVDLIKRRDMLNRMYGKPRVFTGY